MKRKHCREGSARSGCCFHDDAADAFPGQLETAASSPFSGSDASRNPSSGGTPSDRRRVELSEDPGENEGKEARISTFNRVRDACGRRGSARAHRRSSGGVSMSDCWRQDASSLRKHKAGDGRCGGNASSLHGGRSRGVFAFAPTLSSWRGFCCALCFFLSLVVCLSVMLLLCRTARKGVNIFDLRSAFFGNSYGFFISNSAVSAAGDAGNSPPSSFFGFLSDSFDTLFPSDDLDPLLQRPVLEGGTRSSPEPVLPGSRDRVSRSSAFANAFRREGNTTFCSSSALEPASDKNESTAAGKARTESQEPGSAVATTASACLPSFDAAVHLYDWRMKDSWAARRWRYHAPEYIRKAFTLFFPIDRRLHELYRQEMAAILALVGPYVEIEPPVPIDPNCHPPPSYSVIPREQAQGGGHEGRQEWKESRAEQTGASADAERRAALGNHSEGAPSGSLAETTVAKSHPDASPPHVTMEEFCEEARRVHRGAFTGKGRKKPVKIVDTIILGYDLDMLEVRLYELEHTVDYFVILESRHHTTGLFEKPLLFQQNRQRFARFLHKIVYFEFPVGLSLFFARRCMARFLGDSDYCWHFEFTSRDILLWMLARFNEGLDTAGNVHVSAPIIGLDDLIMTGDPDEIIRGDRLRHLKFCEPVEQPTLGWALVHYPGHIDAMAAKEFGAQTGLSTDVPHAIGPLMDTFKYAAVKYLHRVADPRFLGHVFLRHAPSQLNPPLYLYGGWHMSDMSYLPFLMSKIPVDDVKPGYEPWSVYQHLVNGDLDLAQRSVWEKFRDYRQVGASVIAADKVPEAYKDIGFGDVPWLMKCNPMRYPTWFRVMDKRYFMRPNKSFYRGDEPVLVRDAQEWVDVLKGIRDNYKLPGH